MNREDEQKQRLGKWRLVGPSVDAPDAKKFKMEKLPPNCLQRVLSLMPYEKVSQMRQAFNEVGKNLLEKGHRELDKGLKREIERAGKMVLFSTNLRSSFDGLRFIKGLLEAIDYCKVVYTFHVDYFVAGKLLDKVNCLLKDFNSSTVVPYFQEHVYDEKPHPFLVPIIELSKKAYAHFLWKISSKFIYHDKKARCERWNQKYSKIGLQIELNQMRITKINLLKNQRQRIDCGNEIRREFVKLILKLNMEVLDLTQWANKVDEEVERVSNRMHLTSESQNKCFGHLFTPSNSGLGSTKVMKIHGFERPNLATLPSSCIQNIVLHLNCHKMAQLRIVCKSFDEACKQELNQKYENLKYKFEFKITRKQPFENHHAAQLIISKINAMKDICSLMQLCKCNDKWHLGSKYFFAAGKVLDEANSLYYELLRPVDFEQPDLDWHYKCRPFYMLFHLMDLVYKALAHFKCNMVPKYLPSTQNQVYVPDFIFTGYEMKFERKSHLNLEEIEKSIEEEEDAKIKEQNDRNRKYVKIIFGLKKKVFNLKKEISQRIIVLKKMEKNSFLSLGLLYPICATV